MASTRENTFDTSPDAAPGDADGVHPHLFQGTERMRQKLFVVGSGVLVKSSVPKELAGFVASGCQLAGDKLVARSNE